MAEEFQGGVCGGNWWNSSRINLFGSSPCLSAVNDIGSIGGWTPSHDMLMDMKTTTLSNDDSTGSAPSDGSSSVVLQDVNGNMPKPSIDSTLQMMGINLSSSTTTDWNQDLIIDSARSEENYSHLLQETTNLNPSMNYRQQIGVNNFVQDSSLNSFNQVFDQQPLYSISTSSTTQCDVIPMNSASFNYSSLPPLLQTLFESDSESQQTLSDNLQAMNYASARNYRMINNSNEFTKAVVRPSLAKQQPADHLQYANNTQLWNSKAAPLNNFRPGFPPSTQSQFIPSSANITANSNLPNFTAKPSVAKKGSSTTETPFKRPRIETPSPLPTFKVRKEKLGDRITALQQLVSPFGKTDTASVLHEAIEYIKFLHDQVSVLSTPYMKNGSPPLQQHQQAIKDHQEGLKQDLKSRGLCLVPISSTFPVTSETATDFWTPTFGGSFR